MVMPTWMEKQPTMQASKNETLLAGLAATKEQLAA